MIEIQIEPLDGSDRERCCLCRCETHFWTRDGMLALCPKCAWVSAPGDLPTREQWMNRERRATEGKNLQLREGHLRELLPEIVPCPDHYCQQGTYTRAEKQCVTCGGKGTVPKEQAIPELLKLLHENRA